MQQDAQRLNKIYNKRSLSFYFCFITVIIDKYTYGLNGHRFILEPLNFIGIK
jgi:hypothetical protein